MNELLTEIFSPIQLIGYAGMACAFISYQCRKNSAYFALQAGCGIFFGIQFLLLGGWSGFFLNVFSVIRGVVLGLGDKFRKRYVLALIEASFAVSLTLSVVIFQEPWWICALLLIAQCGGTLAMWTQDGRKIRIAQLSFISPIWLFHNSFYKFSVGGILCETFNIISVIVSFIRFGKSGFDKK